MGAVHSKGRAVAVGIFAALACIVAIAAIAGLGAFADDGDPALESLPAAAPCESSGPLRLPATTGLREGAALPIGFNDGAYLARQDTPPESASMQRAVGSVVWRSVAQWQVMEPEPGTYDFSTTDPFYCAALAADIAPLIHITTSPPWAADPSLACPPTRCTSPPPPEHYDDLRNFAAAVTARYPDAVAIEAWNEPNLHLFWSGPDPERYVEVLRPIHDGVKAVDPSMPVLMGGLSDLAADRQSTGDVALVTFLDRSLDAGAGDLVDAFNIHLYPVATPAGDVPDTLRGLAETKAVLTEHDQAGRPIWVTEAGIPADGGITRERQARALLGVYRRLAHDPQVVAVLFHTLIEPNARIVGGGGFGWVTQRDAAGRFHPFPVYCAFARLLADPVDCNAPAPSFQPD